MTYLLSVRSGSSVVVGGFASIGEALLVARARRIAGDEDLVVETADGCRLRVEALGEDAAE